MIEGEINAPFPVPYTVASKDGPRAGGKEQPMKKLRWFQTKVGLFQDPRMMYLLSQPSGDSYFVIWFYLKDLAGMVNDDGYIYVAKEQAVTTALLARQLHRRRAFVEKVLDVFEQIDLISRDETGLIRIVPWHEIQSFDRDEKKRRDARDRMRRYRRRKAEGSEARCHTSEAPAERGTAAEESVYDQGCGDPAKAPSPSAGRAALRRYTAAFGQMSSRTAEELTDLARCWGDEAVCAAIDIARDNGASGIRYIRAVLVNSGGRPRRRETMYERREKEFNQYVDTMLRQIWESDGDGC